jgi:tRNA pseudouridine65 synthase
MLRPGSGAAAPHVPPLRIIYQDGDLVVVDKPSGLLVHPSDQAPDRVTVLQLARDATGGAHLHPVHRLDRGTSGVLVLARSPTAAATLHAQLEEGAADKRYLTAVRGAPPEAGVIDHPIPRREDGPRVPALTEFRRLALVTLTLPARDGPRPQPYALVEARPRSGRLHQIRRHLKHIGHPVLGDVNYGRSEHNRFCRDRFDLCRLALHAASLTFDHPRTAERLTLRAPLPSDLHTPLLKMGLQA